MNGNRAQANNYTLDGIDMNETYNNLISYSPAPEALQEIQVITANSPTDYGNVNGAGVVSVLKTGTNQFHGSAYGYAQDYRFDANSYGNGLSKTATTPATPINPFSFAQFGGTVGGPILHNKLFFFGDYLGSRWHQGGIGHASVMTQAMRNGDFSALLAGSNPIQLYDPLNNFAAYADNQERPHQQSGSQVPVRKSEVLSAAQCYADGWNRGEQLPGAVAQLQGQRPGRRQNRVRPSLVRQNHRVLFHLPRL